MTIDEKYDYKCLLNIFYLKQLKIEKIKCNMEFMRIACAHAYWHHTFTINVMQRTRAPSSGYLSPRVLLSLMRVASNDSEDLTSY